MILHYFRFFDRSLSKLICLQVHQKQTERMRHRSEWFLSDPTGLVTVKCRNNNSSSQSAAASHATSAAEQRASVPSAARLSAPSSAPLRQQQHSPKGVTSSPLSREEIQSKIQ